VRWYTKAAEQGFAKAQYNLGMAYHSGEGVKKDDVEAYFWINIAASFLEQPFVKQSRENIGKLLAADQLSEVQERCRKWVEKHPNTEK
jgi:DNA-binding SARP family transcriptional activator